ncbi:3-keto-5-aminohexanoate cleavage protein [Desulfomarina sp.]
MKELLIGVAPNGARRTRQDHGALPLTPLELAKTAAACTEAGAAMFHLHVRDRQGRHSLDPGLYRRAMTEVEAAVGETMLIQVSSEAAGMYGPDEQIELMGRLAPHCLSIGLREFLGDSRCIDRVKDFFYSLFFNGTRIQFILYSPREVYLYENFCRQGILPGENHFLLFVVGSYREEEDAVYSLEQFLAPLSGKNRWMACGFGVNEHRVIQEAMKLGGHVRVGFENNLHRPDGSIAQSNEELVQMVVEVAAALERKPADVPFARSLF